MDQAVAALCGAGIGVVGTLGASWLTYVGTRRQAPDQGRIEHARQLRTERREAYLAFMELLAPVDHLPSAPGSPLSPERYAVLESQVEPIPKRGETLLTRIYLCGPEEITNSAEALLGTANGMVRLFLGRSQDEGELIDALNRFTTRAREVMAEPPR